MSGTRDVGLLYEPGFSMICGRRMSTRDALCIGRQMSVLALSLPWSATCVPARSTSSKGQATEVLIIHRMEIAPLSKRSSGSKSARSIPSLSRVASDSRAASAVLQRRKLVEPKSSMRQPIRTQKLLNQVSLAQNRTCQSAAQLTPPPAPIRRPRHRSHAVLPSFRRWHHPHRQRENSTRITH
jgi:hypothetical protein